MYGKSVTATAKIQQSDFGGILNSYTSKLYTFPKKEIFLIREKLFCKRIKLHLFKNSRVFDKNNRTFRKMTDHFQLLDSQVFSQIIENIPFEFEKFENFLQIQFVNWSFFEI